MCRQNSTDSGFGLVTGLAVPGTHDQTASGGRQLHLATASTVAHSLFSHASTSNLFDVRPSRCVTVDDRFRLLLPALDFGTVNLLTSGLPRYSQHFVGS